MYLPIDSGEEITMLLATVKSGDGSRPLQMGLHKYLN